MHGSSHPTPEATNCPAATAPEMSAALVAVARFIPVIVWHLLSEPTARFHDLGAYYHTTRVSTDRKIRNLVRQLEALGHTVTLQPAA